MMLPKSKGFTLIELLVAATILFSAIAVVTLIFKSAYVASGKAQYRVEQAGVINILLKNIQRDIQSNANAKKNQLIGDGIIWGESYLWKAKVISFKPPAPKPDRDTGKIESFSNKYKLWQVNLTLGEGKGARDFTYKELSWIE